MVEDFTGVTGFQYRSVERTGDPADRKARQVLGAFFEENHSQVFFARQIEIFFEKQFFHWITARALRTLSQSGEIATDIRKIPSTSGEIHLFWNRRYRYYKRAAEKLIGLVSEYAHPNVAAAIGIHGEGMVLGGFADVQFVLRKRETNEYRERKWTRTNHDLDFIFERDGLAYGVEVKNTLGYPDSKEIAIKILLAQYLNVAPVFVARMMPKTVINDVWKAGGFALILGYQLYPFSHKELAKRVAFANRCAAAAIGRHDEAVNGLARETSENSVICEVNSQKRLWKRLEARGLRCTPMNTRWLSQLARRFWRLS